MLKYFIIIIAFFVGSVQASPITPSGQSLVSVLDSLQVESHWLPGVHVNWLTGEPDGRLRGAITSHCSAFVAAVADHLGVYILRPPAHKQVNLANAQFVWLKELGASYNWVPLSLIQAQEWANQGCLVVGSYFSAKHPGHIVIIRPSDKTLQQLEQEGPEVIQAGLINSSAMSFKEAFARHPYAFQKVLFYGHSTAFCQNPK